MSTKSGYIKVAFGSKIKKYAFTQVDNINFKQIHLHLGLQNRWKDSIFFYQIVDDFTSAENQTKLELSEQDIKSYLYQNPPQPGKTTKLRIIERYLMSEQEKRRKQSEESFEIPENIQKKRSKSFELDNDVFDQTCKTEVFDINEVFAPSPKNLNDLQCGRNDFWQKQNLTNSILLQKHQQSRKLFSKSTQVTSTMQKQQANPLSISNENETMLGSFTKSLQFEKIQNCLHQSIKVTQRQKTELQKLKQKIKIRQKQLKKTQCTVNDAKEILELLDLRYF